LDLYGGEWSDEICRIFEIDKEMLPIPTPSGTQVGEVSRAAAEQTGLAVGTPICVGAGDQNAAAVGAGLVAPGLMSVSLGTGGLAAAYIDGKLPDLDPQAMLTGHPIVGKYMLEGYQPAGAGAYRWFRDEIARLEKQLSEAAGIDVYEALGEMAAEVPPGSKGLVLNPYFASAATPRWNANARASVVGLTFAHDRSCLARAFMEGITLEVKDMINSMYACGAEVDEIRILGGPTRSELWNQIQADVYGRPVSTLKIPDAAVLGAAICAGVGAGVFSDIREGVNAMVETKQTYEPISKNVKIYEELFEVFCDIYDGLSASVYDKLAKIQERY
jgi:xylulokinase